MLLVFLFNKFWFNLHAFVQDQQEMRSADSIGFVSKQFLSTGAMTICIGDTCRNLCYKAHQALNVSCAQLSAG